MTLQTIFEENKERLTSALSGAEPVSAIRALHAELDRILYAFNDQEESDRVREAAGSMMQVAKAACALVDCAGETTIYGRTEYGGASPEKGKVSRWGLMLLSLGLLCALAAAAGMQFLASAAADSTGLPPRWLLAAVPLGASAALFFAGMLLRRGREKPKETLHAETKLDAALVYNRLLSVILVMDKQLEEVRSAVRQEEKTRMREQASAVDGAELELLSRLLEDAYGRRGEDEQAEEEISQIRFYLHRKSIDVVDWSGTGEGGEALPGAWFDMMPAYSGGTIRPALVADGRLLKKGMASAGRG